MAMRSSQDVAIEWRITLFWALARLQPGERIETADIGVSFVKLTRTKDEIPYVGNPLFRDLDTGWFVEQVNVLPVLHSLKPPPKGR
jgi:hypothetical protein